MKGKRAKINEILLQTDFREIKDFFVSNNITWKNQEGDEYIPTMEEIAIKVEQLLRDTANAQTSYCKTVSGNLVCRKTATSLEFGVFVVYISA